MLNDIPVNFEQMFICGRIYGVKLLENVSTGKSIKESGGYFCNMRVYAVLFNVSVR